jgi:hypothetical protein
MYSSLLTNYLIFRFVLDTCRRLKEKKSYMVYTAAGCLGISALSDIIKEVLEPYYAPNFGLISKFTLLISLSLTFSVKFYCHLEVGKQFYDRPN